MIRLLLCASAVARAAITPAQAPTAPAPSFDVASIHKNITETDGHHHIINDPNVSRFQTVNLSVLDLIQFAYNKPKSQIMGAPTWLDSIMFDIDAKSDAAEDARLHAMPSAEARSEKAHMVQALLADRFGLTIHAETRQLPVYALIVAKGGAKFKPSQVQGTTYNTYRDHMHLAGSDDTLAILARELAQTLGRVVLNKTGLTGRFDLTLRWTPQDAAPMGSAPPPDAPPDIFTAIQEQLGLKLESTKGPVDVLVIDHVEMPSEN
jgi:uncharacterized protein (TIGR03435 family)